MSINIIAIVAKNGAIGRGGDQPFHISADFKHFKELTSGHPVIMGRKTFEALPKGALPNRRNIVISRNPGYHPAGAEAAGSLKAAVESAMLTDNSPFIIGGGEIYRQALPLATTVFLTEVEADVDDADTFFPLLSPSEWELTSASEIFTDPRSGVSYRFATYSRR